MFWMILSIHLQPTVYYKHYVIYYNDSVTISFNIIIILDHLQSTFANKKSPIKIPLTETN